MTTRYTYDVLQTYANVLTETVNGETTAYEYGLERIAAYTGTDAEQVKTQYVYDVRGSVIETVTAKAYRELSEATAAPAVTVQGYAYTPYGEQIGSKVSGYGYNGEYYDAAAGMLNLRARQYEPAQMRFSQPDIVRGYAINPQSVNRYAYCVSNPVMYADPSGKMVASALSNKAIMSVAFDENRLIYGEVDRSVNTSVKSAKQSILSEYLNRKKQYRDLNAQQQTVIDKTDKELAELRKSGELTVEAVNNLFRKACRQIDYLENKCCNYLLDENDPKYRYEYDDIDSFINLRLACGDWTLEGVVLNDPMVICGVAIDAGKYSIEEIRAHVKDAQAKGKKIDWDEFYSANTHDDLNFVDKLLNNIGVAFCQLYVDEYGVSHSTFNCWQANHGYDDLYDKVFDTFTDMRVANFPFASEGNDYIFWVWKGDYLNLGAGAEIGIYTKEANLHAITEVFPGSRIGVVVNGYQPTNITQTMVFNEIPEWYIDKSLAMDMSMSIYHKGENIATWSDRQWWLTSFNPHYKNVDANDLTIDYCVHFDSRQMYVDFKNAYGDQWIFNDVDLTARYRF